MVKASYSRRLIFSVVVSGGRMIKSYENYIDKIIILSCFQAKPICPLILTTVISPLG
jgi:hypothetical protein